MHPVPQDATTCCIVGCGPAGAVLGLLLARAGIEVLVLEKHEDFFRDFRGDTIHPSTLDVLDELGLGDRFADVPQQHVAQMRALTDNGMVTLVDLAELDIEHPHIAFVPQWDFLDFLTDAARELPHFELRMGAEVVGLIETAGRVAGVRYRRWRASGGRGDSHRGRGRSTLDRAPQRGPRARGLRRADGRALVPPLA
jgi:2-polyprenyl-6-methoxyphenol hydroxylase-like FAD-dependent oxidoreductase